MVVGTTGSATNIASRLILSIVPGSGVRSRAGMTSMSSEHTMTRFDAHMSVDIAYMTRVRANMMREERERRLQRLKKYQNRVNTKLKVRT